MVLVTLDLSHFIDGPDSQRFEFANDLLNAFKKHGFVKLRNHGFSEDTIQELFSLSRKFFHKPHEVKAQVVNPPGPNPQRGWSGVGVETTSRLADDPRSRMLKDTKEHFDQGPASDVEFPNRWPNHDQLQEFRPFMESCYGICDSICTKLMEALEIGLHLPLGYLTHLCIPSASDLRLNHYPAVSIGALHDGFASRISPHTDFGIISLLLQDQVGGLEIEDRDCPQSYMAVTPDTSEMIVNVSDTLQRWTNNYLEAGVHRVTVPDQLKSEQDLVLVPERFSMAYFFKAGREVSVGPLQLFINPQQAAKYQEMTALEFQKWRNQKMY